MPEPLSNEENLARLEALLKHKGNRAAAGRELGIVPNTMRSKFSGMTLEDMETARNTLVAALNTVAPEPNIGIVERLLKTGATLADMASRATAPEAQVLAEITALTERGYNIVRQGEVYRIEKLLPVGNTGERFSFTTDDNNRIKFGLSSDKHYGSKYTREEVTEELYQWFADEGVSAVLDGGNYIEGESRFNKYDINIYGLDAQAQNIATKLPRHPGLVTYAISGDDHEGWYAQREGIDIGRYVESVFRQNGREDWVNLGYMEAYIDIVNAKTGVMSKVLVMHPGGGSSYATSYRPQKIVEGFEGGEKPHFLLIAHFHKLGLYLIRNVWVVQSGCSQDQTPFMRKKGIDPHIGGVVVDLEQDPETGALISCKTEIKRFFNRGFYNHRWSPHGEPTLPRRTANIG